MLCHPSQRLQRAIDATAKKLQHDWFTVTVFFIDAADLADTDVIACLPVIVQLAVCALDLPAGQELVFGSRTLLPDHDRAMTHLPAGRPVGPEVGVLCCICSRHPDYVFGHGGRDVSAPLVYAVRKKTKTPTV